MAFVYAVCMLALFAKWTNFKCSTFHSMRIVEIHVHILCVLLLLSLHFIVWGVLFLFFPPHFLSVVSFLIFCCYLQPAHATHSVECTALQWFPFVQPYKFKWSVIASIVILNHILWGLICSARILSILPHEFGGGKKAQPNKNSNQKSPTAIEDSAAFE